MKRKNNILLLIFVSLALMTSCKKKKNWQCACTINNPTATAPEKETKEILNCKESEATTACDDYGKTWVNPGGNSSCVVTAE
jgi:hypothetical protein